MRNRYFLGGGLVLLAAMLAFPGCSTEKVKNRAKEAAARYWQDKAYPGKSYDVQVVEAEKADNGMYRVKGIVDGETREGMFNPDTENFSEGYYALAHERDRRIAELEQENKYWKDKYDALEKENYKLKVRLNLAQGKNVSDDSDDDAAPAPHASLAPPPAPAQPSAAAAPKP